MDPHPHRLLRTPAIRLIEREAQAALPPHTLMRRAAGAAAALIAERWPGHSVDLLCGPGNNGGDGLMLAALLHQAGRRVRVWALPAGRRPADAEQAWQELPAGLLQAGEPDARDLPDPSRTLIVDALFGIGLSRPLPESAQRWTAWAARQGSPILALDAPSGLDTDTGGAQPGAIVAHHTLTFIADKPGLHTRAGRDHAGTVSVADLELESGIGRHAGLPHGGLLVRQADCPALFRPRPQDSHKGSFGTLAILAGAPGMTGAALLAARAALYGGAGKILVGLAEAAPLALPCDPWHPELMLRDANGLLDHAARLGVGGWVAGCGLGTDAGAERWLGRLLAEAPASAPLVLDADALVLLGTLPDLARGLGARGGPAILTPHPREAARMLGISTDEVQADRIEAARELAARYRAWVVLKGAGSIVCGPHGAWSVNASGNAGLATAGTGDVLAGMLGALLAQGLEAGEAARAGVWLHGAAADSLVARGIGPIGLTASEIAPAARDLRNRGGH
ncbi:NAD(P)H-hydrate dehydratase [Pigmentiphaga sp. GD03639]|uniref:NAD(P)H-hydrate dehydratase n=1 Tax=Pigmentiphaga sp. GD03639 TaxID=2975354 RepID=UPI00244C77D9|nr:NAD(P)H-hydrate dehydratase [Pigmentiphaga sp. GD03639]MDH2235944.1 NAD(P)H-hydrate dehydratase [Pigmentiphaga sp. GD03639]